jgi:polysaccharide pyruvyl transferase WcaK-like protein
MNILVENGNYPLLNLGDVAMLQVCIARLRELWPDATIRVVTSDAASLHTYCGGVEGVPATGARSVVRRRLTGNLYKRLPSRSAAGLMVLERAAARRWPGLMAQLASRRGARRARRHEDAAAFLRALGDSDLAVCTGGGYITDAFKGAATGVLSTLAAALRLRKPVALLGQGLGPVLDPDLLEIMQAVLPQACLITLREGPAGLPLVSRLGVSRERVLVTGDDAVELAYAHRAATPGQGIGLNLRLADYAGLDSGHAGLLMPAIAECARRWNAPLVPLPISRAEGSSDVTALARLLDRPAEDVDAVTPLEVIERAGACRVVVTGSYHAAVFALSQGIPAVAVARSQYYVSKFQGLADQFGGGLELIELDAPLPGERLAHALERAWESAEQVRPGLLTAASEQVDRARRAYALLPDLVAA